MQVFVSYNTAVNSYNTMFSLMQHSSWNIVYVSCCLLISIHSNFSIRKNC